MTARRQPRCLDTFRGFRCTRSDPHGPDDIHDDGVGHTWGFRDLPEPAWVTRAKAGRLPIKDMTGALR